MRQAGLAAVYCFSASVLLSRTAPTYGPAQGKRRGSGKIVGGRIELDAELPEGASVTVITRDADETFEVDEATERMLVDALAQCESGGTVPLDKVLSDLRNDD